MTEYISEFQKELWQKLDEAGFSKVKQKHSLGLYTGKNKTYVEEWLRLKTEETEADRLSHKESLETEAIVIAKEANLIASNALHSNKRSERAAWIAAIAAIIAAIAAISEYFGNVRILANVNTDSGDREHLNFPRIGLGSFYPQVFTISQQLTVISS